MHQKVSFQNSYENTKVLPIMSKSKEKEQHNFRHYQPSKRKFLYDKEDGSFCGRTPLLWTRLLLFYLAFYSGLAVLIAICMVSLFSTLSDEEPTYKLSSSLIGTNPGLGFRPIPYEKNYPRSVIEFDRKIPYEWQYYIDLLDDLFGSYNKTGGINQQDCNFGGTRDFNKVCEVDIVGFEECSPKNKYGYDKGKPCVFLKLNRIYDWTPEVYSDVNQLPGEMPADLVEYINGLEESQREQIWVSCKGYKKRDVKDMGPISFYPSRGFPAYYFPFRNQPDYLSPLIAIQFESLKFHKKLKIECRAWAKNIIYKGKFRDRMGSVVFRLKVN